MLTFTIIEYHINKTIQVTSQKNIILNAKPKSRYTFILYFIKTPKSYNILKKRLVYNTLILFYKSCQLSSLSLEGESPSFLVAAWSSELVVVVEVIAISQNSEIVCAWVKVAHKGELS